MEPTPSELEAVRLRWRKEVGDESDPPESEIPRLLEEVRERKREIEAEALKMLMTATKSNAAGGSSRSRYVIAFLIYALGCVGILMVVLLGLSMLRR